jgi:hypothetical protein
MQYVEIAKLVLVVLTFVVEVIKDLRDKDQSDPVVIDKGLDLLSRIGAISKVKELQGLDLKLLAPELKQLIARIHDLRAQS